jgi:hypothetical protein
VAASGAWTAAHASELSTLLEATTTNESPLAYRGEYQHCEYRELET